MLCFPLDTVAAISEKQKMLQKQRQEIEEIERNSDREVRFERNVGIPSLPRRCYRQI